MARKKKTIDLLGGADPTAFPSYLHSIAEKLAKTYDFVQEHLRGNSGQTYQIRSRADKAIYCLKTVRQSYSDVGRVRDTLKKEVEILRPLVHRCLPKVHESDFTTELPFYVCTFHPGETWAKFKASGRTIELSEAAYTVTSLIDTLEYLHSQGRTHCDLHEENILIGPRIVADGILIIDLGSGHRLSASLAATQDRGHLGLKRIVDIPRFRDVVERADMNDSWRMSDFKALGRLLALMSIPLFGKANSDQRDALMSFAEDLLREQITSWREVKARFEYVLDPGLLLTRAERYLQRRDGSRPQIPLPATGAVRVGDAALAVINTPTFQRLRGIKQLSFCEWYFPGATHTRFEHSLGVFSTAQHALRNLCHKHEVKARFSQTNIDGALLASLIHDVGHYPLAHVIEHYVAARYPEKDDLKKKIHHFNHSLYLIQNDPILKKAIEDHWGEEVRNEAVKNLSGKSGFLSELLDGPVDCDKLDYLRRDAHHCGVPYGSSLHAEEILGTFTCSPVSGNLVIPEEQIAPIEGMIYAQDQMLSTVYWAKTTRALFAMFHRFLDITIGTRTEKLLELVSRLKKCNNEWQALHELSQCVVWAQKEYRSTAMRLISLHGTYDFHELYVPVQKYSAIDRTNPRYRSNENIYREIVQHNLFTLSSQFVPASPINWRLVKLLRASYVKALKEKSIEDSISNNDVLIDVPWGKPSTNMVRVLRSDGTEVNVTDVSHISPSFFSLPAAHIAPIRIYLRPDLYSKISQSIESLTKSAEEIFDQRATTEEDE